MEKRELNNESYLHRDKQLSDEMDEYERERERDHGQLVNIYKQ